MTLDARVTHNFPYPPEAVFDAWLDPIMIGRWMFGPAIRDEQVVSIEIDPRVGGAFSFLVRRENIVIDHIGKYLAIDRPKHIEFRWGVKGMGDSSRVIVDIVPAGDGSVLTLVHELHPDWAAYFDRAVEGWGKMMAVLQASLAG